MASNASGSGATRASAGYHPDRQDTVSSGFGTTRSPADLAKFRAFADVMRDAIGEYGRINELSPEEAAERGCLGTLKSLHRRGRMTFDEDLCDAAARGGQLEVLKWLRENSFPWDKRTCEMAASSGHLAVLKWLRANGAPWDESMCASAAASGKLEVLRWLCANGCPWNDDMVCQAAQEGGDTEVLKWLHSNVNPGMLSQIERHRLFGWDC